MRGLDELKKKPKPVLVKMAKKLDIKVWQKWNRTKLATEIIKKEKLKELEDEPESSSKSVPEKNPELEAALDDEQPPDEVQEGPRPAQDDYIEPGSVKDLGGRTQGLTDEKARIERLMKNQVPDPVYIFFLKKFFTGWQRLAKDVPGIKLSDDEAKLVGIPATNLMTYYFPNLHITPVLETWFGLYMSLELVIGSRLEAIKLSRSGPVIVNKEAEKSIIRIIDKLKDMPPDRIDQFAGMLGVKDVA